MFKNKLILLLIVLFLATAACNFVAPTQAPQITPTVIVASPSAAPTGIVEPTSAATPKLPLTEAQVSRVPVDQAKAAFDSGIAIFLDVRTPDAYAASHIKGAINIPLGEIELNPTGLNLDKNKWIITYCT